MRFFFFSHVGMTKHSTLCGEHQTTCWYEQVISDRFFLIIYCSLMGSYKTFIFRGPLLQRTLFTGRSLFAPLCLQIPTRAHPRTSHIVYYSFTHSSCPILPSLWHRPVWWIVDILQTSKCTLGTIDSSLLWRLHLLDARVKKKKK